MMQDTNNQFPERGRDSRRGNLGQLTSVKSLLKPECAGRNAIESRMEPSGSRSGNNILTRRGSLPACALAPALHHNNDGSL